MSGVDGDTGYLVHTNLTGAYNCLELARRDGAFVVFLSTSRVYPVAPQVELKLEEAETRFEIAAEQAVPGVSPGRDLGGVPAGGRPHPLRRHQARRRAADRGVPGGARRARGDRPLRRDRRPLADGQGRPGRLHPLDARPPLRQPAHLHRLRRRAASRSATCSTSRTWSTWSSASCSIRRPGMGARSTSAAAASAASRCGRRRRSASELTGNEVPIDAGRRDPRRATCPIYLSDCARLFGLDEWRPAAQRRAGACRHLRVGSR